QLHVVVGCAAAFHVRCDFSLKCWVDAQSERCPGALFPISHDRHCGFDAALTLYQRMFCADFNELLRLR
ncbi:MAG: hypothetical protein E6471_35710, partial [Bradyrhizobium sp.]|nr:hypothetical protein [Bradyrhizobium sp.]